MQYYYSEEQATFILECFSGKNVFLTGKAGTGKSFIVKEAIRKLKEDGKEVIALAPTGVAAYNIDGQTMHSMFSLPIFGLLDFPACSYISNAKKDVLRNAEVIFIDEVSMLRPDVLDALHLTLIKNGIKKGLNKKQIIFIGDLKQLPSPVDGETLELIIDKYQGVNFFDADIFPSLNVEQVELNTVHRQSDDAFIKALNVVRDGGKDPYFKQFVTEETGGIILAPHNSTVSSYNEKGLSLIKSKLYTYDAKFTGKAKATDFMLEKTLRLKDGCKIMYLVNAPESNLHNGSLGIFRIKNNNPYIEVDGKLWDLITSEMTKKEYYFNEKKQRIDMKDVGTMSQLPVKLAYALTIHKSQGLTFDEVTVDLTKPCFEKGQLYTALSRVKTPSGLKIKTSK